LLNGLNRNLEGYAQCPVCGTTTRLSIVDGKIDGLDPGNAILHVLETPTKSGRTWVECEPTHIFDKKSCSEKWLSPNTKGDEPLSLLLRNITSYWFNGVPIGRRFQRKIQRQE
jgi:hypothetical protein